MIHILDYKTEKIVGTLENKEETALFWQDIHKQSLKENLETFDFTMQADVEEAEHVSKRNRVIIPDEDGFFREFIIHETKQHKDHTKDVYTSASFVEIKKQKIIEPVTLEGQTINTAGDFVLSGTCWQVGITEYTGTRKVVFEEYIDSLSALKQIASIFELEPRFRIEVKGNRIIGRFVDFISRVGINGRKEIELGKDLIGITRKENTDDVVTSLIVLGPEKEDGKRLVVTVQDEEALQRWSDKDGRHLWDIYEPQTNNNEITESELTSLGREELNKRINSLIEYTADAASIEHIFGYEHEKVRIGDTTRIKDTSFVPPLYVEARVIEVDRSISDPSSKSFVLGDFIEYNEEDIMANFKKLQAILQQKVSTGEIQAVREYIDQQDQANYEGATHYADVVSETAKNNAVTESISYIDDQVSQVEETINEVEQQVKIREIAILKQATEPSGTNYIVGQLWIRTTDNTYHRWTGTEWKQMTTSVKELAEKAGLEYVNGQLIDKANKANTYTKTEVDNALNSKVSTTTYTTDKNGIVQDLSDLETRVEQNEKAITFTATKEELNTILGEVDSIQSELSIQAGKIESKVEKTEFENLTIGFRNLLQETSDSDKAFSFSGWQFVGEQVTAYGLKELSKGGRFTMSADITKHTAGSTKVGIMLHLNTASGSYRQFSNSTQTVNALQTGRIISSYDIPVDTYTSGYFYIRHYSNSDPVSTGAYAKAKLEKGNKATDWQKAPEDFDRDISGLGTKITNAESRIIQTEKDIISKVSTTTYITDVGGLKDRMYTAESTISQHSTNINLKVDKNGVISAINISPEGVKIEAKKLLVGDFTNLCENPDFEGDPVNTVPRGFNGSAYVMDISSFTQGNGSNRALAINAKSTSNADAYGNNLIPVVEGDEFYVEFEGRFMNTLGNRTMGVGFRRYDQKGVALSSWIRVASLSGNVTSFTKAKGTYKVPSGTGYLQIFITFPNNNETTNIALFDNIKIHRRSTADLIVKGSITAEHINVSDLSAITSTFSSATSANKSLINGDRIRSESVGASYFSELRGGYVYVGEDSDTYISINSNGINTYDAGVSKGYIDFGTDGLWLVGSVASGKVKIGSNLDMIGNGIKEVSRIDGRYGNVLVSGDEWLRINEGNEHTSGVYFNNSLVRTDGTLQVGSSGSVFNVNSNELSYNGDKIFYGASGTAQLTYSASSLLAKRITYNLPSVPRIMCTIRYQSGSVSTTYTQIVYTENVTATYADIIIKDPSARFTSAHTAWVDWVAVCTK